MLNFSASELWSTTWKQDCSAEDIQNANDEQSPTPSKALTYAGYLGLFRYASQMRQLSELCRDDELLELGDISKLEARVREIQGWTINLHSSEVSNRFEEIRMGVGKLLQAQSEVDAEVSKEMVRSIEDFIDDALEFIGIPQLVLR